MEIQEFEKYFKYINIIFINFIDVHIFKMTAKYAISELLIIFLMLF